MTILLLGKQSSTNMTKRVGNSLIYFVIITINITIKHPCE